MSLSKPPHTPRTNLLPNSSKVLEKNPSPSPNSSKYLKKCDICAQNIPQDIPHLTCEKCGAVTHQKCYDLPGFSKTKSFLAKKGKGWKCRRCAKGKGEMACVLCGRKAGIMLETKEKDWYTN
eukprot:467991-Amorphochlora_amoeboformis.AAC.1